ncbi:MAG: methyltransferase [candidate division NC10 bacterium RBG_16_65_8]|nr:MAG: methyltransferase [candidate division NC10 bacterium RBG_16_65_8]
MSTREPQYQRCLDLAHSQGPERLGLMVNQGWHDDPRRLGFTLARYTFVAKMFAGRHHVLEVGCGDAFGTRIVRQAVERVTAVDFDPVFIADAMQRASAAWPMTLFTHNLLAGPVPGTFDAAFALDVLEHIHPEEEDRFLGNLAASVEEEGAAIIGTPSLESQAYASEISRSGHVNCKTMADLKKILGAHFRQIFGFGMNDGTLHTGHEGMSHYLLALCCGPRKA